jgi:FMN phosphatase YigB (HAD superfamily)
VPRKTKPRITTVVFDLDDTLYDCHRQRVLAAHRYACRKLLAAGLRRIGGRQPSVESLYRLRLRLFREEPRHETLDLRLCHQLGLDKQAATRLAKVGHRAYFSSPVGWLRLFPDTLPTLKRLHRTGTDVYILTAGRRSIQQAKVRKLGLHRSRYVQGSFYTGLMGGGGKKHYLKRLLHKVKNSKRILVVGDRVDSEIRAARELGLWAVRRAGGEFVAVKPHHPMERPHHTIRRLAELFALPFDYGDPT